MLSIFTYLVPFLLTFLVGHAQLPDFQGCNPSYEPCSPPGASSRDVPAFGPNLSQLYLDLLHMVNVGPQTGNSSNEYQGVKRDVVTMCCMQTTDCRLVPSLAIPACWDRFTTDFFLPDGSYGTLSNGSYTTYSKIAVNLISGNFTDSKGQHGNIYEQQPNAMPNTYSLHIPTPFTSKGVGTAIPGSQLGVHPTTVFLTPGYGSTTATTSTTDIQTTGYGYPMSNMTATNQSTYGSPSNPSYPTFSKPANEVSRLSATTFKYSLFIVATLQLDWL